MWFHFVCTWIPTVESSRFHCPLHCAPLFRTSAGCSTEDLSPSVSVFLLLPEKGIIKSQRVFDVLLATDRGHYIKYFPYMDSPQSIGEWLQAQW